MEVRRGILILLVASCALTTALADNPYRVIVDRNAFGLNPPPPPAPPPPPPEPPPPEPTPTVRLTGITTITKPPKAIFEIENPGEREKIKPPPLAAGMSMNGVEVLLIDVESKSVKIRTGNVETNVTFEVAKLASPTPPPPVARGPRGAATAAMLNNAKTRSDRLPPVRRVNQPDRTPGYRPPTPAVIPSNNSRISVGGAQPATTSTPATSPYTPSGSVRVGSGSASLQRPVRRSQLTQEEARKLLEMMKPPPPPLPPVQ